MGANVKTIGFRGTAQFRQKLQEEALQRGLKVQSMIEEALNTFLKTARAEEDEVRTLRCSEETFQKWAKLSRQRKTPMELLLRYGHQALGGNLSRDEYREVLDRATMDSDASAIGETGAAALPQPPAASEPISQHQETTVVLQRLNLVLEKLTGIERKMGAGSGLAPIPPGAYSKCSIGTCTFWSWGPVRYRKRC